MDKIKNTLAYMGLATITVGCPALGLYVAVDAYAHSPEMATLAFSATAALLYWANKNVALEILEN